jgi:hypothetical protein
MLCIPLLMVFAYIRLGNCGCLACISACVGSLPPCCYFIFYEEIISTKLHTFPSSITILRFTAWNCRCCCFHFSGFHVRHVVVTACKLLQSMGWGHSVPRKVRGNRSGASEVEVGGGGTRSNTQTHKQKVVIS